MIDRNTASAKNRREGERENEIKSIFEHNFLNKHLHSTVTVGRGSFPYWWNSTPDGWWSAGSHRGDGYWQRVTLMLAAFCLFKVEEERTEGSARPPRALATTFMAFDGAKILINALLFAQTEVLIQERKKTMSSSRQGVCYERYIISLLIHNNS